MLRHRSSRVTARLLRKRWTWAYSVRGACAPLPLPSLKEGGAEIMTTRYIDSDESLGSTVSQNFSLRQHFRPLMVGSDELHRNWHVSSSDGLRTLCPKKHVTTFSAINLTIGVRLQ